MSKPVWFPLYIPDYLADTMSLTTEQHGAYLLLLMEYWQRQAPLVDDTGEMAAICRMPPADFSRIKPRLARFFQVDTGVWRHKRVDAEIEKTQRLIAQKSVAGRASAQRRGNGEATAVQRPLNGEATADPTAGQRRGNHSHSHSQKVPLAKANGRCASLRDETLVAGEEPDLTLPPALDRSLSLKERLFGPCLDWLWLRSGKTEAVVRSAIGKWLRDWGEGAVLEAFMAAQRENCIDPIAWISVKLETDHGNRNRKQTAGEAARAGIAAGLLEDAAGSSPD